MLPSALAIYLLSLLQVACAVDVTRDLRPRSAGYRGSRLAPLQTRASERKVPEEGFYNPYHNGGHLLTVIPVTWPMGQGEPINAVISGHSDQRVLVDRETDGGLRNYFLSLGFSGNCLGQKQEEAQAANLGDGNGNKNETDMMRWNYGDAQLGSCRETIEGGNHFRFFPQDGPDANSGAVFLAISYEKPIRERHAIIVNGYNLGRDWLLGNITKTPIIGTNITEDMVFSGNTSWASYTYQTTFKYVQGILPNTSDAVNHNYSVPAPGINASDGWLAIMNVQIVAQPDKPSSAALKRVAPAWQTFSLLVALAIPPSLLTITPLV